jgi:flavin-dependent dehydrogenase
MAERGTDVLVLGGGPAGSTAGILLAEAGIATTIVEAVPFPRFHVGGSLVPATLPLLDRLGVHDGVASLPHTVRKEGVSFLTDDGVRHVDYWFDEALPPAIPHAYQVRRDEFDAVLLDRAREVGVTVVEGWRGIKPLWDGDRVAGLTIRDRSGEERELRARAFLDASGQAAFMANRMGWRFPYPRHRKVAAVTHVRGAWRAEGRGKGNTTIVSARDGWSWFIPFAGETTSIGTVVDTQLWRRGGSEPDALLAHVIATIPEVRRRLEGAEHLFPALTLQDFSYRVLHRSGDGYCLVGDAAGFLDPIFSTGVFLATETAASAARDISEALARHGRVDGNDFAPTVALTRSLHRIFFAFIRSFYDPNFLAFFYTSPKALHMGAAIASLLAGDVLHPARWRRTGRLQLLVVLSWLQAMLSGWGVPLVEPLAAGPSRGAR